MTGMGLGPTWATRLHSRRSPGILPFNSWKRCNSVLHIRLVGFFHGSPALDLRLMDVLTGFGTHDSAPWLLRECFACIPGLDRDGRIVICRTQEGFD